MVTISTVTVATRSLRLRSFCIIDNLLVFLPPANVVCEGYIFTGVCDSVNRGGGWRVWFYLGGHAWFYLRGGVHGFIWGGMRAFIWGGVWFYSGGACVVSFRGHAWFYSGGMCAFIWGGMRAFM